MGMREAQGYEFLRRILDAARDAMPTGMVLILKGDGDGGEERLEVYCKLVTEEGLEVLELINTTALAHIKAKYGAAELPGGLAGADPDYHQLALRTVKYVYEAVGDKVDIIATGGVNGPEPAIAMIRFGASAVGVNTAIRKHGLSVINRTNNGVAEIIHQRHPWASQLSEIVGIDTQRGPKLSQF